MTRTLPGSGLTGFWPLGNNTYKDAMDANLRLISVMLAGSAISRTTTIPGSGSIGNVYIVPAAAPSNANSVAVWDGAPGSEAWVYLTPKLGWHLYVDDTNENVQWDGIAWVVFAGSGGGGGGAGNYDLRFGFKTAPTSSQVIDTMAVVREIDLPANLAGSLGLVGTNPTSTFVMELKDDGTTIATISISTSGVFTFATIGGTAKTVLVGSELSLVAPAAVSATIANMTFTLLGSL